MEISKLTIRKVETAWLNLDAHNARAHNAENLDAIMDSLKVFGQVEPLIVQKGTQVVLGGNGRLEAMRKMGWKHCNIVEVEVDETKARALSLALNQTAALATWDDQALAKMLKELEASEFDLGLLHFDASELDRLLNREPDPEPAPPKQLGSLSERFLVPPFSVLDARQGYWQERKREWLSIGIESDVGRGENLLKYSETVQMKKPGGKELAVSFKSQAALNEIQDDKSAAKMGQKSINSIFKRDEDAGNAESKTGTSIFDPVLCELAYSWFSKKGARCLDPFAGGSVRGIVAAKLGRIYHGIDLRPEQVEANRRQADEILGAASNAGPYSPCLWECGDSSKVLDGYEPDSYDLLISCPPYADLEVYSDDPADISNMPYAQFLEVYSEIIAKSVSRLKRDRFIFWVIGEVRETKGGGFYRGFVPDTIRAFEKAGARLYNEAILVTSVGTLPLRVPRYFAASRKLGKTHQNILVFVKGSAEKAVEACGDVEIWQQAPEDLEGDELSGILEKPGESLEVGDAADAGAAGLGGEII